MASDPIYDGYRLCFSRDDKHLYYALTLIDPTTPYVGHLYQLKGPISLGQELQIVEQSKHNKKKSLRTKEWVFRMPQSFRKRFDMIVRQTKLPFHPDALTQSNPGLCPYTDREWVMKIVRKTNFQPSPLDRLDS